MDPISQGVVGAVVAASLPRARDNVRLAALTGWIGGMLADADVLIRSERDPLLVIEYHRHFTHSLVFIPVGGLICAALFWCLFRGRRSFGTLAVFSTAGYATAGLLDACTSYGTQLFWPFADTRVAWSIISIVDPVFTVTLLVLMGIGAVRRRAGWMRVAVGYALLHLGLGVVQHHRAASAQRELAAARGHGGAITLATVKPTIGNLVLWRSLYRHGDAFHVDAIRVGWPGSVRVTEGQSVPVLNVDDLKSGHGPDSVLSADLDRFDLFSAGYLVLHPDDSRVVGDLRYAMLPNSARPLWGIRFDPVKPDEHVRLEFFRERSREDARRFLGMLRGE